MNLPLPIGIGFEFNNTTMDKDLYNSLKITKSR